MTVRRFFFQSPNNVKTSVAFCVFIWASVHIIFKKKRKKERNMRSLMFVVVIFEKEKYKLNMKERTNPVICSLLHRKRKEKCWVSPTFVHTMN